MDPLEPKPVPIDGDTRPDPDADEERRRRRIATLVLVAVLTALLIWLYLQLSIVPNTQGMSERRARAVIEEAGFRSVNATTTPAEAFPGRVLAQTPVRGIRFVWQPVEIAVSARPETATAGGVAWEQPDASFEIVAGNPATDGEVLPVDAEEVDPTYLPLTAERVMPNVQNLSEDRALQVLRDAGLSPAIRRGPSTTDVPADRIYYQLPEPGTPITGAESSVVWISTGPFNILTGKDEAWPYPRPPSGPGY